LEWLLLRRRNMRYENFFDDNKYKMANETIKILINNLVRNFQEKCIKGFYPKWRRNESSTEVFVLKLEEKLVSKYGKKRENIITVRLRMEQLDIEVFRGIYCNGKEFSYNLSVTESELVKLYKDINDLFISMLIN
jgi:hypothetical protein